MVNPPCSDAGIATPEDGLVLLDGPGGVAVTMTPDAATRTGQSLIEAAKVARQRQGSAADGQGS